jgi:diguanylate cyclase (GGDEF)-like protein
MVRSGTIARVATILLLVLALAVVACAAGGLFETARTDSRQEAERHAALQVALDEFLAVFGDVDRFGADQLGLIAQRAGLNDLRFDADLTPDRSRETQSLHNGQGRIIGWFSWAPDRALIRAMNALWDVVAVIGVILALCAVLALRAAHRLSESLRRSIATVKKLSTEDALTGLPNRRVMLERLDAAVAARRSRVVAFAVIDIDGFGDVNDTLGRAGGDAMLASIAERLTSGLPPGALLGRFEDDEFAVIASGDDTRTAARLADALVAALAAPIYLDQKWQISVSVGAAQAPEDGTTGDELSRRAVLALRAAKRNGRGSVRRFEPQIQEDHAERRFLLRELESAVLKQSFEVHYQPVVAAEGGAMIGVEALLRWTHPSRGAIAPAVFIPLAEESGLMIALGELVLRRALKDGARWPDLFVSVNLSPVQIRSRGLVDLVADAVAATGIAASRVVLEVTEGILIDDPEQTQTKLEALRALGVATALDDFGSGYSSLSYLQKFPFDRLKIDRAFVASLGTTGNSGAIIQSIVTLGHALGMKVLAEGIETNEQRVLLRLAGCDEMQGYLFAKPAPAEAIDKILARLSASRPAAKRGPATAS